MKVLLVQSYLGRKEKLVYPLGLVHIAAPLRDQEVKLLDPNVASEPYEALRSELRAYRPDVVAVSLRNVDTTHSYDPFFYYDSFVRQVKLIKSEAPGSALVVGGPGFSIFAETIMKRVPEIDFGVFLEGDESFAELLANIGRPHEVKGIYYRDSDAIKFTGVGRLPDLSLLPHPRWDLADLRRYRGQGFQIGLQTKRGCPFKCLYCVYPFLSISPTIRLRPPEMVGEEIEQVLALGAEEIHFCDEVFNYPIEHAEAVCREIIRRRLRFRWRAFFNEKHTSEQLVKLAQEAGCAVFEYSPDGYSDRTLQSLRKALRTEDLDRVYSIFENVRSGRLKASFILNAPGDSTTNVLRLLWFVARMSLRLRYPFFSTLSVMRIYPHTGIHEIALEEGLVEESDDLFRPVFYNPFPLSLLSYVHDGLCWLILKGLALARREWSVPF